MKFELSHAERMSLAGLVNHPGYQVLLDVMEREREKEVTALLKTSPADHNAIIGAHNTARAYAVFVERLQKTVNFEINEALATIEQLQHPEPSEDILPGL